MMRYKLTKQDFWQEMEAAIGRAPQAIIQSGDEIVLEFEPELSPDEERRLNEHAIGKRLAVKEKGMDITPETMPALEEVP